MDSVLEEPLRLDWDAETFPEGASMTPAARRVAEFYAGHCARRIIHAASRFARLEKEPRVNMRHVVTAVRCLMLNDERMTERLDSVLRAIAKREMH